MLLMLSYQISNACGLMIKPKHVHNNVLCVSFMPSGKFAVYEFDLKEPCIIVC